LSELDRAGKLRGWAATMKFLSRGFAYLPHER
jgi:hypothetical protein